MTSRSPHTASTPRAPEHEELTHAETARRMLDALDGGDYGDAAGYFHRDAQWHNTRAFPGPTIVNGP